ncbi:MAG: hypothetical protein Q4F71_03165 [Paracoccus sp. (in: a-proteobacteria)]|nr:hypothetical protein [Paracoccus sp. (in: a-proteobacteria)]
MIRTISIGTKILIQGIFERDLDNGDIMIRVGKKKYRGKPVLDEPAECRA